MQLLGCNLIIQIFVFQVQAVTCSYLSVRYHDCYKKMSS